MGIPSTSLGVWVSGVGGRAEWSVLGMESERHDRNSECNYECSTGGPGRAALTVIFVLVSLCFWFRVVDVVHGLRIVVAVVE